MDTPDSLPKVRIKDAWLLRTNASVYLNELWGKNKPLRTDEEYAEITAAYREAWQPFEHIILKGMQNVTGLSFRQNMIDVYVAPWFSAFSDPLVIGVTYQPDVFIDTLTHELIHRLLSDNTTIPFGTELKTHNDITLYGEGHNFKTLIHISVHAVHKAIYLDILDAPERLTTDIDGVKQETSWDASDYVKAWEYVDTHDNHHIIHNLKGAYAFTSKSVT
jgi:hypothetical protein